ncbi:hypothetical protein EYR40_006652 [Pleurotus pulmonarius]|nr:hypothetical protein EYR36_011272 [Pleurotus pulmonarius]KAF4599558.1 hypothetical protein EYR40_006652 [Pleurotus pulmonarius]
MSLNLNSKNINLKSSLCPTNGCQAVGDGAKLSDNEASVLAVCQIQGHSDMYYYSTTFSGGPGKCPPDGGSSDCVTDRPTPYDLKSISFTRPPAEDYFKSGYHSFPIYSQLPQSTVCPRPIPQRTASVTTPPLTPDSGTDSAGPSPVRMQNEKDALDFLMTLFPKNGLAALPYARSVSISAPNMGASFDGVVVELPGKPKTLYVDGKSAQSVALRESIVALLDLADDNLQCSALVIALERSSPALGDILHSLMYVGGTVVTKPPFQVDPAFVLVGLEI